MKVYLESPGSIIIKEILVHVFTPSDSRFRNSEAAVHSPPRTQRTGLSGVVLIICALRY